MDPAEAMRRSEVGICKWMAWSYADLMATPRSVVGTIADVITEMNEDRD